MKLVALFAMLAGAVILSAVSQPVWSEAHPVEFQIEGRQQASQKLIEQCSAQIEYWAGKYTDTWYDHMEQCVYLDPDYLVEIAPEGEE